MLPECPSSKTDCLWQDYAIDQDVLTLDNNLIINNAQLNRTRAPCLMHTCIPHTLKAGNDRKDRVPAHI